MLRILINAYACSPNMGSEPGMGWNWCVSLAKYCELEIISEGEFRDKIEAVVPTLPQGKNLHFHYNPVSDEIRRMCWNQGDWRFYKYYKEWQWKTYQIAKDICENTHIDVLHQLNMIGFREPGYLWKLSKETGIPFVWGPIGGLKQFPKGFLRKAGLKQALFNSIKNTINVWQLKHDHRVKEALHTSSALISSIPDSQKAIKRHKGFDSVIIPETGCFRTTVVDNPNRFNHKCLKLLWVGKFDFRKQLEIAIAAIAKASRDLVLTSDEIRLIVCGTGNDNQVKHYHELAKYMDIDDYVEWKGQCAHEEISNEMQQADVLFFTSISDDTSTVVMEAISNHLPVLCHDAMGFGYVVNEKCGMKISLIDQKYSVNGFAEKIEIIYSNRSVLEKLSVGCNHVQQQHMWDNKAKEMIDIYKNITTQSALQLIGGG